jgi:hypothetical protein
MSLRTPLRRALVVLLCLMLSQATTMFAENVPHLVTSADMQSRVSAQEQARADTIALFQRALDEPQVRAQALTLGLDVERAKAAIPFLSDAELASLARRAVRAQDVVAGHETRGRNPDYDIDDDHLVACLILTGVALVVVGLIVLIAVAADDEYCYDCW